MLCNESKSQKAIAVIGHRKRVTVAPESSAIARCLQQEGFLHEILCRLCKATVLPVPKKRTAPFFLPLVSNILQRNRERITSWHQTCNLFSSVYWAECMNMSPSFTSRDSPHCYTLSPPEASFHFYRERWGKKKPKSKLCIKGHKVLPASAAGGLKHRINPGQIC